ncbi:MAG: tRNA (adenosine(37)-N6)-threonylcarbamoyltransferase complex dimerization subunit type 1 TsaB [Vicinamibacterales bacterium]|nr:tRNA (adenosine(37)-N6)-threonylcarbamoyltransferase complex dimerization subunit type 1 TsaB [Vicinamibacterales bacterium]
MRALALDTTTPAGSVAVIEDARLLAELEGDRTRTHTERLPAEIAQVLAQAGVARQDLDLLVVATGPGAFTGLRIGLAVVQGLAMALDRPAIGVSALDALAWSARAPEGGAASMAVWMEASRGEVFGATYTFGPDTRDPVPDAAPVVGPPAQVLADWAAWLPAGTVFVGDAARRHADLIGASGRFTVHPAHPLLAGALAHIGRLRALAGQAGPPHALQPLYVRRPDVELERERRAQLVPPTP